MVNKKININEVTKDELINVKHIGESLAAIIISERTESGPFKSLNDFYNRLLPRISRPKIDKFIGNFSTPIADDQESDQDEISVTIKLKDVELQNKDFCGYLLLIDFIEIREDDKIIRQIVLQFTSNNNLIWCYKPEIETQDGYKLRVKSPSGYFLKIGLSDQDPSEFEKSLVLDDQNISSVIEIKTLEEPLVDLKDSEKASVLPRYATGRLLDFSGQRMMENIQVVFYGAIKENPTDADFFPIASVYTEKDGYFSIGYPIQSFAEAYAVIGIPETENVPIGLESDPENASRFPKHIILVVQTPLKEETSDCDCKDLEFHRSKKVLEEYSYYTVVRTTEPEIKAKVLEEPTISLGELITKFPVLKNDVIAAVQSKFDNTNISLTTSDTSGALVLSTFSTIGAEAANQFKLDDIKFPVSLFKNSSSPNFALNKESIGEILHQGLVHDLGKFIGEKKGTAPGRSQLSCQNGISWDKNPEIYQACTIAHGHLLQFKQEWIADGYSIGDLLYSLPLAPNQKKRIVVFDWDRRESASRFEQTSYEEDLYNSLRRDRDLYEVAKGILTEKIKGGSLALTAGYGSGGGAAAGIISGIVGVVGSAFGIGGGASVASQTASRKATASSFQKLIDKTTQSAHAVRNQRTTVIQTANQGERFEVQSEIIANYNHCHAMTVQYFEVLRHFKVGLRLANIQECLFIPLEISEFTMDKVLRWREILSNSLLDSSLAEAFPAIERIANNYKFSDMPTGSYAEEDINYIEGELYLRFKIAMPKDDLEDDLEKFNEENWHPIVGLIPWLNALDFYNSYLKGQKRKERIFQRELAPRIAEAFVESLQFYINGDALSLNATLMSNYRNDTPLRVSLRQNGPISDLTRIEATEFNINAVGLDLPEGSKVIITRGHLKYRTKHISEYLIRSNSINQDIYDNVSITINPPTDKELEKPRDKDNILRNQLLSHLNYNLEYYHHAIWMNMDPDRRYMILDGIMAPCKADGRSVASVVENNLIGFVGNCLVMPVVPGLHLDPTFDISENGTQISLLDHYMIEPPEPSQISIPTKGVFAEAVMGKCNSCEEIDETRFWRWHEVPSPDEPTEILPIDTVSRRAETPDLTPSEFPAPIVNIQNAPPAPDPTGLAKIIDLLRVNDAFRDLSGLSQNQLNALSALQSSLQTAQNFGNQAASLQAMRMRNLDKNIKTINDSKNLTPNQKRDLEQDVIKNAAGIKSQPTSQPPHQNRPLADAIRKAMGLPGSTIEATTPEGEVKVSLASLTAPVPAQVAPAAAAAQVAPPTRIDGIDIYDENDIRSFTDLMDAGIRFIIHQVTKGIDDYDNDREYSARRIDARSNRILFGGYHLLLGRQDIRAQADQMADVVRRVVPMDLPPALDLEGTQLAAAPYHMVGWLEPLETFLDRIETALGRVPMIYTRRSSWHANIGNDPVFARFNDYPLWVLDYTRIRYQSRFRRQPGLPGPWNDWTIWQYSDKTPVELPALRAEDPRLDMNVTNGGIHMLRGLADLGRPVVFGNDFRFRQVAFADETGTLRLLLYVGFWLGRNQTEALRGADEDQSLLAWSDVAACQVGDATYLAFRCGIHLEQVYEVQVSPESAVENLGQYFQSPTAACDPTYLVVGTDRYLLYWASDDTLELMKNSSGSWEQITNVTEEADLERVSGRPALYESEGQVHVVGRMGDQGHLWDVRFDGAEWHKIDLTEGSGGPPATYQPATYEAADGFPRIVYRALRGGIHQIDHHVNDEDLSQLSGGAPTCAGNPAAFAVNGIGHVVYRRVDGRLHEIYLDGAQWKHRELICAGHAVADPAAHVVSQNGVHVAYVVFRERDGLFHELQLRDNRWTCETIDPTWRNEPMDDDVNAGGTEESSTDIV